jgi:phosphatidylglycerol---prolipoprotein diacylglyceryl transferase
VLPELDFGPVELKTFGICLAAAFLGAAAVVGRRLREIGKPVDWAYEMLFAALVGGILGARLHYIVENYASAKDDLLGSIFSGSGLVWFGGLLGGAIGVILWARWRGFLEARMADAAAPGLALGYAIGRVGCQLSGDGDYGRATDLPWGMAYPDGTEPISRDVHPTPVFETVAMGLVALVLWNLRDRVRPGGLFALYLVLAGVERLLIEFIRRNDTVVAGLTEAQLMSIALIAGGAALLTRLRGAPARAAPAA